MATHNDQLTKPDLCFPQTFVTKVIKHLLFQYLFRPSEVQRYRIKVGVTIGFLLRIRVGVTVRFSLVPRLKLGIGILYRHDHRTIHKFSKAIARRKPTNRACALNARS